jgi:hypothetical protein
MLVRVRGFIWALFQDVRLSTPLALPRQRLASESDNLEAGSASNLITVGRRIGGPKVKPEPSRAATRRSMSARVRSHARSGMFGYS